MARDDWQNPANLWGGIVGPPGTMKTPAISEALRPLRRLAVEARKRFDDAEATREADLEALGAKRKAKRHKLELAAKKGDEADLTRFRDELKELKAEEDAGELRERRYMTSDATIEKLGMLLNENPRGLLVVRDELTGWLKGLDREDRAQDRAFYLEAWNGTGAFTVDRIGRGTLHVEALCLSVFGGIQPGRLSTYVRGATSGEEDADGLLQRKQVLVWPDEFGDWRGVDRWPEREARDRAFRIFDRLANLDASDFGAEEPEEDLPFLRFAPNAQGLFIEWRHDLEARIRSEEVKAAPAFEAHLSKYRSLFPKLALIFHLVDVADGARPGPVALKSAQLAAAWTEFLEAHARKVYAEELAGNVSAAHALAEKITNGKVIDGMAVRDIGRREWSGLKSSGRVFEAAESLEALGWLRVETVDTGGRPSDVLRLHEKFRSIDPEEEES
jgi:putative DNA primase/helicase